MTISARIHVCISFCSQQTLTCSASLSPSHFFATFSFIFLIFFSHLSTPFDLFPFGCLRFGIAPSYHLRLCVCPLHPNSCTFLAFASLWTKQFPHPRSPSPSPPNPTSSTLLSLPFAQATVIPTPLQMPGPAVT